MSQPTPEEIAAIVAQVLERTNPGAPGGGQDPAIAQFTTPPEQIPPKFSFGGREWNSREEAELAIAGYAQGLEREKARLEGIVQSVPQNANAQYTTGKEAPGWKHSDYLEMLANGKSDEAQMAWMKYKLFGDPNAAADPFQLIALSVRQSLEANKKLQDMELRTAHPEIDWNNTNETRLIDEAVTRSGAPLNTESRNMAISYLQQNGKLRTRAQWEAAFQQTQPQQGMQPYQQETVPLYPQQPNVVPMRPPGPPAMGRPATGAGFDIQAALEKMADPNTPIEEAQRLLTHIQSQTLQEQRYGTGGR